MLVRGAAESALAPEGTQLTDTERMVLLGLAEIIVLLADMPSTVQHIGGRPREIADRLRMAAMEGADDAEDSRV